MAVVERTTGASPRLRTVTEHSLSNGIVHLLSMRPTPGQDVNQLE